LLNAHPDDLDDHLRHVVSLLCANDRPLDWFRLFEDVIHWDDPEGRVQLRWARDFYAGKSMIDGQSADSDSAKKEEEVQVHE